MDEGTFTSRCDAAEERDPLGWGGYLATWRRARAASAEDEAVVAGEATVGGHAVELVAFEFSFMGGSLGEVAGERVARALERAARRGAPVVVYIASGGARMQEGMRALVQLPKIVVARGELARAHQPLIAVAGNPTTGGVLLALCTLADATIAEAGATVGFAGPRVVQQVTGRPLSVGSHRAENALAHGLVDAVAERRHVRRHVVALLEALRPDTPEPAAGPPPPAPGEVEAWDAVVAARAPGRLSGGRVIEAVSEGAVALRGDRAGRDDPAIATMVGRVGGRRALLVATDRRHRPRAAGYRKVVRCLRIAERLGLPVISFIDTPGADPSESSEAEGIAWAVAETMEAMLGLAVPTLAVVTGEGGSGGALALATADVVVAFSDAIFTVIAPELAAEILWRDARRAPDAARALKLTAPELVRLGIADAVIPGPPTAAALRAGVAHHFARVTTGDAEARAARRRARWRGDRGASRRG
ncbi:MAG TPA: carboxyl transferase domain-containing protein [Actinomycetota bacterium]|nr:carboxyl transferase domain-containing protein [Actinomycetota bacterium]